jgi:hypothetical protein
MLTEVQANELGKCYVSPIYFIDTYCHIYDNSTKAWLPFRLWPAQEEALHVIHKNQLSIVLKARQIGLTWCALGYALWQMIFRPIAVVLLFSKRDDEARYLLGVERLKGMHKRLPDWMLDGHKTAIDSGHEWSLENDSIARAFPTTAGDSYSATFALVDEADLAPDLGRLMISVKPTIDHGGKMVLLSRSNKEKPESHFKKVYREAKMHRNEWASVFLPWYVHPERNQEWYARQRQDSLSNTGALDDVEESYPATDTEALAPRSLDKRIPAQWIEACYVEEIGSLPHDAPAIPGLIVYRTPQLGRTYVLGVDPAEGNPTSDDSALTVLDKLSGEECAVLSGKFQPAVMASYADKIGVYFNWAGVMVERNNHGHAVILWLTDHSYLTLLNGHDERTGWLSSQMGKTLLYDKMTDYFRDNAREKNKLLHSFQTYTQLASIEGNTLRAPEGMNDDRADSYALAEAGRTSAHVLLPVFAQGSARRRMA